MRTLLLMRHAKAQGAEPGMADHERPLDARGQHDAPRMGRLLRDEDRVPDLIISSTARRARQTAWAVATACGYAGPVLMRESLYLAEPPAYRDVLRELPTDPPRVLAVGHNPGLEELLLALAGVAEPFPTAALAELALPLDSWRDLDTTTTGRLVHLWRPKDVAE